MQNVIRLIRRLGDPETVEFEQGLAEEMRREPMQIGSGLLASNINAISRWLDALRGAEMRLEQEIADRQEELRQTRVAISAYTKAESELAQGQRQEAAQ